MDLQPVGWVNLGFKYCPVEYDTLRIRTICHSAYDAHCTIAQIALYADDVLFFTKQHWLCDLETVVAGIRALTNIAKRLKSGHIPKPKRIVIEVHNPFLFLILTRQAGTTSKRIREAAIRLRGLLRASAPIEVRFVNLSSQSARTWTGNVADWREVVKFSELPDLTPIETQEALQVLYKQAKQSKMKALNDR